MLQNVIQINEMLQHCSALQKFVIPVKLYGKAGLLSVISFYSSPISPFQFNLLTKKADGRHLLQN